MIHLPDMTCSEFHGRFSEYYDGTAESAFLGAADAHVAACADCRRYHEIVARGAAILRTAPPVSVSDDFFPRLRHRIYHLEDGPALGKDEVGSATTVSAALVIAAVIALAAWSPLLMHAPQVKLPPIVVNRPEPRVVGVRPPTLWSPSTPSRFASTVESGLWDDPELFTRYSPLTAPSVRQTTVLATRRP